MILKNNPLEMPRNKSVTIAENKNNIENWNIYTTALTIIFCPAPNFQLKTMEIIINIPVMTIPIFPPKESGSFNRETKNIANITIKIKSIILFFMRNNFLYSGITYGN